MKNIFLMLCSLVILSCSKTNTDPTNVSASGSISYKVNGTLITIDNANIANGEGVTFAKQLKGSVLSNTRYLLNAQKGANNLFVFTITSDSLQNQSYQIDSALVQKSGVEAMADLMFNGQLAYILFSGDEFNIQITSYNNSKISGTFSAKLTPIPTVGALPDYNIRGSLEITEGKLNNVQVIY